MAVALGPLTTSLVATGTLSTTFAFTSTDQPLYVLLGLYPTQIPRAPTGTVTYGGVALELVNETFYADPGGDRSAIYRLVAPTPGTANVVVTHNEVGCEGVLGVFNTLGQDPGVPHGAAPIWASTLVQKTNTTGSCPVDPAPGDLVVWVTAAATTTDAGAPITMTPVATGATATQLYQGLGNSENVCFATAPWPATAVATTWNNNPGGAALAALVLKAAPAVAPVWTATSSSAAGTTNAFVVPSTALVGQLAVAALYFEETGTTALTLTPVAGWTISAGLEQVGSTPDGWLFYAWKRLAAGDLGATVGFASNGSWKEGAMVGLTNALAAGDPLDVAAASAVTGAAGTGLAVPDLTPASQPTLELVLASTAVDTTDLLAPAGLTEAVESGGTAIFTLRRTVTTPPGARTVTWAGAADALGYHLLLKEEPPPLPDGQLLAPSADTSVGTWTTDTGATTNLFAAIDEASPADADYARSVANPQAAAYEAGLPAAADPDVHTGHGVRVRAKMDVASADPVLLTTELRQGAAALSPPAVWTDTLDPTGATFTHALTAAQAAGITDYGALRERFTASQAPTTGPPTFVNFGTMQSATTAAVTVPWPAHLVGDVALLCVERAGGSASPTLTTANGFAAVAGGEQTTGTSTLGTKITLFWCRATTTSMASPVVAASTDHQVAVIVTFRSCVATGNPWDVVGGGVKAAASASVSMTGVTTTVANTLVAYVCARDNDANGQIFSAQANASLTGVAERFDDGTLSGGGGGLSVTTGGKATAGASGTMTATVVSGINAWVTIALKPTGPPATAARAQVTWTQLSLPPVPARLRTAPAVAALGYTSPYADAILATAGLTAYYQLDDTTGIAYDRVGGRHGAYEGAYSRVAGVLPGGGQSPAAVRFAGAGGVRCPVTQTGTADWTLECWFTPGTLTPAAGQILIAVGSDPGGYSMAVSDQLAYGGPGTRFVAISNGYGWADSGYNLLSVTSAYHLVVKRTGGLLVRFYVNGVLQTPSGSGMGQTVPGDCTTIGMGDFGSRDGAVWRRCEGTIDEAAVYNVALSDATVLAHYNAGIGLYSTTYPEARSVAVAGALAVPTETITSAGPMNELARSLSATATTSAPTERRGLAETGLPVALLATPAVPTQARAQTEAGRAVAATATLTAPTEALTRSPQLEPARPVAAAAAVAKTEGAVGAELARALALTGALAQTSALVLLETGRPVALTAIPAVAVQAGALPEPSRAVAGVGAVAVAVETRGLAETGRTVPLTATPGVAVQAAVSPESARAVVLTATPAVPAQAAVWAEPLRAVAATATPAAPAQSRTLPETGRVLVATAALTVPLERRVLPETARGVAVLAALSATDGRVRTESPAVALLATLSVPTEVFVQARQTYAEPLRPVALLAAVAVAAPPVLQESRPIGALGATAAVERQTAAEPARAVPLLATPALPVQGRVLTEGVRAVAALATLTVPVELRRLPETARAVPLLAGAALPVQGLVLAPEEQAVDAAGGVALADQAVFSIESGAVSFAAVAQSMPRATASFWELVPAFTVAGACAHVAFWMGTAQASAPISDLTPLPLRINPLIAGPAGPDEDLGVGGWTTDTGATTGLFAQLDEAVADDADYDRSGLRPAADELVLGLAPLQDAGTSSAGSHLLRVRYAKPAGGSGRVDLTVTVQAGATDVAVRVFADIGTGWTTAVVDLTPSEIAAFRAAGGYADPRVKLVADQVG